MINIIWILSIYVVVILANAILNFTVSVYKIENIICKNHCFVKDIEVHGSINADEQLVQNAKHIRKNNKAHKQEIFSLGGFAFEAVVQVDWPCNAETDNH